MQLFYRKYGFGPPIIILHGLYGSSDNWVSIGRILALNNEVWLVDQRNHGKSPHDDEHSYKAMMGDLLELMDDQQIENATLIGHSMGGKTVMHFAIDHPDRVKQLIVLDIAPKSYLFSLEIEGELNHKEIMKAMLDVDFKNAKQRNELDGLLARTIRSARVRQFLLKNVKRAEDNSFEWIINIRALYNNLEQIMDGFSVSGSTPGGEITGFPVLFVKGGRSGYIMEDDKETIQQLFPYAQFKTVENAGHWLHAEQPDELIKIVKQFIDR